MSKKLFWPLVVTVIAIVLVGNSFSCWSIDTIHLCGMLLLMVGLLGLITVDRDNWFVFSDDKIAAKKKKVAKKATRPKSKKR